MAVRWRVKIRDNTTCQPYRENEFGEGHGCIHWKSWDNPPAITVCNACPLTGMFCAECKDLARCPRAGLPKVKEQSNKWISMFYDNKTLSIPYPSLTHRDKQALRLVSNVDAQIQSEIIKETQNGR